MVLAYTTPKGWSMGMLIAYAGITNTLLMTLYSMTNMPYSALGGVITADLDERARLNSFRFIAVNIAQFIVGGFTLPLVALCAIMGLVGLIRKRTLLIIFAVNLLYWLGAAWVSSQVASR